MVETIQLTDYLSSVSSIWSFLPCSSFYFQKIVWHTNQAHFGFCVPQFHLAIDVRYSWYCICCTIGNVIDDMEHIFPSKNEGIRHISVNKIMFTAILKKCNGRLILIHSPSQTVCN